MDNVVLTEQLEYFLLIKEQRDKLETVLQTTLQSIRTVAGRSTFKVNGKWYQIRTRNKLHYMCELDGPPRGRPRKSSGD